MRTAPVHPLFFVGLFFVVLVASASAAWAQTGASAGNPSAAPGAALPQPARAAQRAELPGNAQPGVAQTNTAQTATAQPAARTHQLIERIHVEGGASSIDEVRVGGETRSITVQPKGGLPAYDVQPTTGTRAWKVLGF